MTSHIKIKLELNSSNMIEVFEAHQGDKKSRFIDVMLTSNGEILQIGDGVTAKYDATINNIVVANDLTATIDTTKNVVTVELTENMLSISGLLKIDLKILESNAIITAQTIRVKVGKSVINSDSKFTPIGGTIQETIDEVAAARGNYDSLNNRINSKIDDVTGAVKTDNIAKNAVTSDKITPDAVETINIADNAVTADKIANKAVTNGKIANGAITATKIAVGAVSSNNIAQGQINTGHMQNGAVTVDKFADEVKATINGKADKSTTYTKTEVNNALSSKLDDAEGSVTRDNIDTNAVGTEEIDSGAVDTINIADNAVTADKIADKAVTNGKIANGAITATKIAVGAVSGNNIAQGQINTGHMQSGAVTSNKLADEVKASINSKYDSSNVETGSGVLTSYNENTSNKINSASFSYQRSGAYVTVSVYIDFKAFTVDNAGINIMLLGLPYVCKNAVNPRELCVTTSKQQMIYAVTANTSNLTLLFINTGAFDVNEKLSFTVTYKIS